MSKALYCSIDQRDGLDCKMYKCDNKTDNVYECCGFCSLVDCPERCSKLAAKTRDCK